MYVHLAMVHTGWELRQLALRYFTETPFFSQKPWPNGEVCYVCRLPVCEIGQYFPDEEVIGLSGSLRFTAMPVVRRNIHQSGFLMKYDYGKRQ